MLRAHREQRLELCTTLGVEPLDDGFVFSLTPDGSRPLRPATATQRYRRLAERLRLRSTRLHSLRHYSATELPPALTSAPSLAVSATATAARRH
jgi:integrase